jgi:hypothetical protein
MSGRSVVLLMATMWLLGFITALVILRQNPWDYLWGWR